jgi:polyisoprenoid-binding protein YceI
MMTIRKAAVIAAVACFARGSVSNVRAEQYSFDGRGTELRFTYRAGFFSHAGRFSELSGKFDFDEAAPAHSGLTAIIKTASLKADSFEDVLKGGDFFNVTVWREIRFRSHAFKPSGKDTAEVEGDLTMRGVTRPATFHVRFEHSPGSGPRLVSLPPASLAGFDASTRISRSAFDMTSLGFLVDDEIEIRIHATLKPAKEI